MRAGELVNDVLLEVTGREAPPLDMLLENVGDSLEFWEAVNKLEEAGGFQISDAESEQLLTVGDLHRLVAAKLSPSPSPNPSPQGGGEECAR
jgi:acyl carrier protein